LQKAIRMQTEAWALLVEGADYRIPKEEHAFMHEARIRRELILNNMIH
jgi:hypothetical protein